MRRRVAICSEIRGLSLCSGIGGIDLALASTLPNYRTVCYVEGEAYAAACLVTRMEEGRLHPAPIWSDVSSFSATQWRGVVDLVSAGYPCQPFSLAGRRQGKEDPRYLWPHIKRIIRQINPWLVFLENVPGHITMGLGSITCDLQRMGYIIQGGIFSAEQVGAPHVRKRLFILAAKGLMADADSQGQLQQERSLCTFKRWFSYSRGALADATGARRPKGLRGTGGSVWDGPRGSEPERLGPDVADAHGQRCREGRPGAVLQFGGLRANGGGAWRPGDWSVEPNMGRVVNGVPFRMDRLRALGNAVVPQTAALAFRTLMEGLLSPAPLRGSVGNPSRHRNNWDK